MPACCPSPVCVHQWVSIHPVCRLGPGVQPSGVQPIQCPITWLPHPDAAVRPASVQPVRRPASGVCPSARSQPSRPASARCWRRGHLGTAGQRSRLHRVEFHVVRPPPRRLGRRPQEAWMRAPLRSRVQAGGGASAADLGRDVLGREAAANRPGRQTAARAPVAGDCARAGELVEARRCRTTPCGRPSGLAPRLLCVVVAEPNVRVDGSGRTKRARRPGWRAAPARPSQEASATGSAATAL